MRSKTVKSGYYKIHTEKVDGMMPGSPDRITVEPTWDGVGTLSAKLSAQKARELGKALIQMADEIEAKA